MSPAGAAFSWQFLEEIASWSRWVALASVVAGTALTRDFRFALACGIGAAVDIRLLRLLAARGQAMTDEGDGSGGGVAAAFGLRLGVKALLLLAAFLLPGLLSLSGMAVGVLVAEITMMTVGAAVAARRVFSAESRGAV